MLQCVAVCCSVLQCGDIVVSILRIWCDFIVGVILRWRLCVLCSVLQRVAVCCSVLQCVAVCCSVLQCVAVCCIVLLLLMLFSSFSVILLLKFSVSVCDHDQSESREFSKDFLLA